MKDIILINLPYLVSIIFVSTFMAERPIYLNLVLLNAPKPLWCRNLTRVLLLVSMRWVKVKNKYVAMGFDPVSMILSEP